ncbi:MAG: ferritin [Acidaminobacteraceae bacterium]
MISKKLEEAINSQINAEFHSAYLYLSMASYFEGENLPGFANWMRIQFEEEQFHAFKMFDYLSERGGRAILTKIEGPQTDWDGLVDVFESTLKHEQLVTSLINNLADVAQEEKDRAALAFLQWYIEEQVEEESNVETILSQLKFLGGKGHGILMLDRELATRTFVPPVA